MVGKTFNARMAVQGGRGLAKRASTQMEEMARRTSVQIQEVPEEEIDKPKACMGTRHFVTFMLFLGMANAYVMRTNMSVAIVAMVNDTALPKDPDIPENECEVFDNTTIYNKTEKGPTGTGTFIWDSQIQSYILSSFFYGYVVTQIPFGILAKKYGARKFLGYGMLLNSVFGLLVPVAAESGFGALIAVRVIQGLGEGPIVPCSHTLLAKWIPPSERSRMGAFLYGGAQFGTVISMPLSGLLAEYGFSGGWPSIFYVFGFVGIIWSLAFIFLVHEDPITHPTMSDDERSYILTSLWGKEGTTASVPVPKKAILMSLPFWAILVSHVGHNWGYETLMTELPSYMKQVLHFDIKQNGFLSALPYLAMWIFSIAISHVADWLISKQYFSRTATRKIINTIGQWSPAIALVAAAYTGCDPALTVAILTVGVGLNGGIYSGFKVNHLDISPRFAGILMSFTNFTANVGGFIAPITAGYIIHSRPTQEQWRKVFLIASGVYFLANTFYLIFGSAERQSWDMDPEGPKKNPRRDSKLGQQASFVNQGVIFEETSLTMKIDDVDRVRV